MSELGGEFKMLGNLGGLLSQVQNMQSALKGITFETSVGGGDVTVTMNGAQELLHIKIAPELIAGDITRLEDMVTEGLNKVQYETRNKLQEQVSKITGINLSSFGNLFQG